MFKYFLKQLRSKKGGAANYPKVISDSVKLSLSRLSKFAKTISDNIALNISRYSEWGKSRLILNNRFDKVFILRNRLDCKIGINIYSNTERIFIQNSLLDKTICLISQIEPRG